MADRTDPRRGNGHMAEPEAFDEPGPAEVEAALDALDAEPMDADEAAAGAAAAGDAVDETLAERVEAVVAELGDVERAGDGASIELRSRSRRFAILGDGWLEVALDATVARAALRTPDTSASPRAAGWVRFTPGTVDRYALDRAEAWIRFAHRLVAR